MKSSQEMYKELNKFALEHEILEITCSIINDSRFWRWSGASKSTIHHYGKGGLGEHVYEVIQLCLTTNKYFQEIGKGVNETNLFLAALFHDVGKLWDYEPLDKDYKEWGATKHKFLIHHITRSALEWEKAKEIYSYKDDKNDEILHAILAHHGFRQWGSPVEPNTRLAWILHLCDALSARVDDCVKN